MNFDFSEEQNQLREALVRLLDRGYEFARRKQIVASDAGWSRDIWRQLAELGALAIRLPEAHGGAAGTAIDTLVVMEALGRRIVVEPYVPAIILGAGLVSRAGSDAQRTRLLPRVASGEQLLALAHDEADTRYELARIATRARPDGTGYVLDGQKTVVLGGGAADTLIVSARTAGEPGEPIGVSLFLVDTHAAGVRRHSYATHDDHRAADVTLTGVKVAGDALLGPAGGGLPLVEHAIEQGIAAVCAEALGVMAILVDLTASYVKTRKQFGVPIGQFQVLQHRLADMLMRVEQARSMTYLAATTVDSSDAALRRRITAAAKAMVGQAARFVGQQAIQLHGGIGVTDEAPVSHYFKRLTLIGMTFGDADHHLARYSDLMARGPTPAPRA
ncbi:MAG: pimeloyl-CoA dehydrogenase small subunit [Deltaproteobacteria bacterium]|nr:MAG: pimeloyl-CoA dehydrogenase small subunit [Deltaproteobacteria bacterium]TMQ07354.1 MAG: pimeloyl-CoA dehydrogenase small subunit [Deltaproteobacteria bacterium]